jgi:chemotaxis protein methyltransferase WspC
MTLIEAGLRPEQFRVDAFDISQELLRKAEEGLYSERAFRGAGATQRARFFDAADDVYRVRPEVRANVHFAKGNLMDPAFLIGEKPYDAVFCRNVLIYQHAEARKRTIALLDRLLAEDGVLFVGHAEVNGPLYERFSTVPHPGAFALTRNSVPKAAVSGVPSSKAAPKSVGPVRPRPRPRMSPTPVYSASAAPAEEANLEQARFLADQGRLDEAAVLCEQLIRIAPGNASAHFFLGVVHAAAGKSIEAEECMNRAIYLDAEHHDALMHVSLLLDRRGETARADLLRRRAAKVHDRGEVLR